MKRESHCNLKFLLCLSHLATDTKLIPVFPILYTFYQYNVASNLVTCSGHYFTFFHLKILISEEFARV